MRRYVSVLVLKLYLFVLLVSLRYPTYIRIRFETPSCIQIISIFTVNHGVGRLWPVPSPAMCQLLNQEVHRRRPYTMEDDACAWSWLLANTSHEDTRLFQSLANLT